jgi:hypothetical protein
VLECFNQRKSLRSVDTHYACYPADYNLIDVMVLEKSLPFFKDKANQVDNFAYLFILDFHGLAKLLSSLVCMPLDPLENGLSLISIGILCK